LREKSPSDISRLMGISDTLATLNVGRYHDWSPVFTPDNAKQAVLAFMGDVYEGLNAASLNDGQLDYLQQHLRILSGLYGLLRPLDLMQPYRLEMGTRLANPHGANLYAFWGERITNALNALLDTTDNPVLVNLASDEYFKAVKPAKLHGRLITPVFQDYKNGQYKIISFYAKQARGLMARWAALHVWTRRKRYRISSWEATTLTAVNQTASAGYSGVGTTEQPASYTLLSSSRPCSKAAALASVVSAILSSASRVRKP
jgi:cytoplasmic iron level regulating protein YaaA (DUF328/UPF0246 family)